MRCRSSRFLVLRHREMKTRCSSSARSRSSLCDMRFLPVESSGSVQGSKPRKPLPLARSRLFRLGLPQTLDDDGGMRERSSWNQVLSAPVAFSPEDDFDLRLRFFASLIAWSVRKDVHDEDIRDAAAASKSASVRFPVGDREEGRAMRAGKGRPSFQTRDARVQLGVLQHILDRRAYRRIAWTLEEGL